MDRVAGHGPTNHVSPGFSSSSLNFQTLMRFPRRWTLWTSLVAITAVTSAFVTNSRGGSSSANPSVEITVYKSPTCGCCAKWIDHLTANGFKVTTRNMDDVNPIKNQNHVPEALRSCPHRGGQRLRDRRSCTSGGHPAAASRSSQGGWSFGAGNGRWFAGDGWAERTGV